MSEWGWLLAKNGFGVFYTSCLVEYWDIYSSSDRDKYVWLFAYFSIYESVNWLIDSDVLPFTRCETSTKLCRGKNLDDFFNILFYEVLFSILRGYLIFTSSFSLFRRGILFMKNLGLDFDSSGKSVPSFRYLLRVYILNF